MTNRIDGGSLTEVEYSGPADSATSAGAGSKSESASDAPVEADPHDQDIWGVGDAVGDFWEDVKGTASGATQAVEQSARQAAAGVGDALESFDATMHEVADVPDQIIEGGEELFEAFELAKVAFARDMDEVLESHPPQMLADVAEDALDGAWNVTQDVAEAVERVDGGEIVSEAADAVVAGLDLVDEMQVQVRKEVVTLACEVVQENRDVIEGAANLVEAGLSSDALDAVSPFLALAPGGGQLETTRRAVLMLANSAKHAPGVAKTLLENPEAMEAFVNPNGIDRLADKIAEVDVGEPPFVTRLDVELSAHDVLGGSLGLSSSVEVERRAAGTLRVTVETGGEGAIGVGLEALGEGAKGDIVANSSAKMVVDFHGEDAEEQVARLIAGSRGEPEELLTLARDLDATVVASSGTFGTGLSTEVGPLAGAVGLEAATTTIDGQPYAGGRGQFSVGAGEQRAYLQTPDGFSAAVGASTQSIQNPLVAEMIDAVPAELSEGVIQAYGPTAGLRLAGDVSAELGVYQPLDGEGGTRLEFNRQATLQAGRSTFSVDHSMAVTDLGGLAEALGRTPQGLIEDLKGGNTTPMMLGEALEKRGHDIGRFLQTEGPTITMSSLDGFDVGVGGQRFMEGRQRTGQVYPPPEGRTSVEQLAYLSDQWSKPVESSVQQWAAEARTQRLDP
jgi:hypothetical protein